MAAGSAAPGATGGCAPAAAPTIIAGMNEPTAAPQASASNRQTISAGPAPVQARQRWRLAPPPEPALFAAFPDRSRVLLSALGLSGLTDPEAARDFLERRLGDDNPFRLAGMAEAVGRIRTAIRDGASIAVYGDYDADGVTATALLCDCLTALGAAPLGFIPHRERDGYGLNTAALTRLADRGVTLVITVDCGIRAADEIAEASRLGLDFIVTDHHALPEDLPAAVAVINPNRPDCGYGFGDLAGVGLAYKLAQALLRAARATGEAPPLVESDLLDLVAVGTVADMVPLRGENRALVAQGLVELRRARRPGFAAMLRLMDRDPASLDAGGIGFGVGPRLNAAGRMDDAAAALDLLRAPDFGTALPLAERLEAQNEARRVALQEALAAARARIEARGPLPAFLVDASAELPLGVVGLVAGRLAEHYRRPAAVLRLEGETARGSARSIPELDLIAALDRLAPLLIRHGGHPRAAGFTLASADLPRFEAGLLAIAERELAGLDLRAALDIAAEIEPSDIGWRLQEELEALAPFGEGNRRPVLLWREARVGQARTVGADGSHLKLVLEAGPGLGSVDAIAFGRGADLEGVGSRIDLAFTLDVNTWRGERRLQLMVEDLASSGPQG